MAFFTIEEAIIKALIEDSDIKTDLGSKFAQKVFVAAMRPQLISPGTDALFPNISVNINYGPEEPAIHAMNGVATIMMEFKELVKSGIPTEYSTMSLLKEHIFNTLAKVDFSANGLVVNHFNLLSGSQPTFDLEDKVWRWPLIFEFVHESLVTKDRVGVETP